MIVYTSKWNMRDSCGSKCFRWDE